MAFSSLNVSDGLTASALTMPRRVFSWMRRSRSGRSCRAGWRRGAGAAGALRAGLATVPPCDEDTEDDVQAAEAGGEEHVGGGEGDGRRRDAEEHEADAHHRHDADGEHAAADEGA